MRATEAIRRLRREGWEERPGKGSHLIFRKAGKLVVIANHPGDIPTGTLREICRQAGWEWPPQAQEEPPMTTRHYIAVADLAPSERMWSIVFPDFPGVTSAAPEFADVPQQARDALATAVEDMVAEGEGLPPSVEEGQCTEADPAEFHDPRYVVVPVEVPEGSARINVSIDRSLLKRIDEAALRRGMTRSGFLAEGARKLLRAPLDQSGSR
jgi:predicted RNA binding protein YcfA (HicA-like mRNA interferase family)/predicted RNase H-like HicB family nuclease